MSLSIAVSHSRQQNIFWNWIWYQGEGRKDCNPLPLIYSPARAGLLSTFSEVKTLCREYSKSLERRCIITHLKPSKLAICCFRPETSFAACSAAPEASPAHGTFFNSNEI